MITIFILILVSVLAGVTYYLARRFHKGAVEFFPSLKFRKVMIGFSLLTLFLIFGFARGFIPFPGEIKQVIGVIGSYSMGVFVYLLVFTLLADVILLIPRCAKLSCTRHRLFNGIAMLTVLSLTLITCIYGFINGRQIDHVSYEIQLHGKQDISDLNIVLISDLHLGSVGSEGRLEDIVNELNSLKPDVVCIAGDFFDTDFNSISDPDAAIKTLQGIRSTYGVYACLGNHDGGSTHNRMLSFLKEADIHLLNDEYTVIDGRFVLAGRLDASSIGGFDGKERKKLDDFLKPEDTSLPVIVLDHNPARIGEYNSDADLILCGHTHKGQIFPGGLITDAIYEVDYGYYRKDSDSPHVIVTSGIGSWGMPMRVGTDSEIVTLKIKSVQLSDLKVRP